MPVRSADPSELEPLARLWHDGWHDAHAGILPPTFAALRTLERFRERLRAALPQVRVLGPLGAPVGFCLVKGDELYQLYVAAAARGTGAAAELMADAEAGLLHDGVGTAWLACAVGNDRAARFYEKSGWRRAGTVTYEAEAASGTLPVAVWRYEKHLSGTAP